MRMAWATPLLSLAIVLLISANASAQSSQEGMIASCAQLASDPARLACFDALARASHATQRRLIPALLFEWQTLVAGILAVVVAAFSVHAVRQQIQLGKEQEDERIRRRHAAARASLPLRLTEVVEFAQSCASEVRKLYPIAESDDDPAPLATSHFNRPEVPSALIEGLERMIEASPDDAICDTLADLISQVQILSSRMRHLEKYKQLNEHSFSSLIVDIAEIYTFATSLFRYARREVSSPTYPANGIDLHASIRLLGFFDDHSAHKMILEAADKRKDSQLLRTLAKRSRQR